MKAEVVVGFSVNPEITCHVKPGAEGQKLPTAMEFALSGTSFDVAMALKRARHRPYLIGAVGSEDLFNGWLRHQLTAAEIPHRLLEIRERTATAVIEPTTGRHLSYKPPLIADLPHCVVAELQSIDAKVRVVTGLPVDPREVALAKLLLGGPSATRVLNPRQELVADQQQFLSVLGFTDWLIINRHEARAFQQRGRFDPTMFLDYGPSIVVMTMDRDGAVLVTTGGVRLELPAYQAGEPVHETGAGDCFSGYLIAGYLEGRSWEEALAGAVVAAGIKVTQRGSAASPTWTEVGRHLAEWNYGSRAVRSSP